MNDEISGSPVPTRAGIEKVKRLAWFVWGLAMCAQLFNMFHRIAISAAIDRVMADMQITALIAGNLMAMHFLIYATMQFPSGVLADSFGSRKTIFSGCLVAGLGSLLFGLAPTVPFLYAGRALVALGTSVMFVSVLKIGMQWFEPRRFPLIVSLVTIISSAGSLVATAPLAALVTRIGWRTSFNLVGLASLVIGLLCWLIIRNDPSYRGLPKPRDWSGTSISGQAGPVREEALPSFGTRFKIIFEGGHIWPLFMMGIGIYGTALVFQGAWGIPYLMQIYGLARGAAANFIFIMLVSQTVGAIIIPYVTEKLLDRKTMAVICSLGYALTWVLLIFWNQGKPPLSALYPISAALGFFVGYMPMIFTATAEAVSHKVSGMALGVVNMSSYLSAAILQGLVGSILDWKWAGATVQGARVFPQSAFQLAFLLVGVAVLTTLAGAFMLKAPRHENVSNAR
jgi:sugar phosphate permease